MFTTTALAPAQFPKGAVASMLAPDGTLYVAAADPSKNGRIDPAYLLLAYAFDANWSNRQIRTTYQVPDAWILAAQGLGFMASTLPIGFNRQVLGKPDPEPVLPTGKFALCEVALQGDDPPDGTVLAQGDIFTPNANGFHNIPRLYLMAALLLEHRSGAAVLAMVANASGLVIATGSKWHGEKGCGHAEVRALFSIKGRVPDRAMLFSTLRPCTMCAGLIQAVFSANGKQYWARPDPSNAADYKNVKGLALDQGQALWQAYRDQYNVREIKLGGGGASFTDEFSDTWRDRGKLPATEAEMMKPAFAEWCKTNMVAKREIAATPQKVRIRVKEGVDDLLAKAVACGTIEALSKRGDFFERMQQNKNTWTNGVDAAASKAIVDKFQASGSAKKVLTEISSTKGEKDIGIIEFIASSKGSRDLRCASRDALASKFAKYGKSAVDIKTATGVSNAAPSSTKAVTDLRMPVIVDYLMGFVQTQR